MRTSSAVAVRKRRATADLVCSGGNLTAFPCQLDRNPGAGFNILRIGLLAYPAHWSVVNVLLSVLVFGVFQRFIFGKLVHKHTARISGYQEQRHFFLKFFDGKAFAIMAVMMSGGIGLRASGLAPERFIAVFYTGLGAALLLAGLLFGRQYGKAMLGDKREPESGLS